LNEPLIDVGLWVWGEGPKNSIAVNVILEPWNTAGTGVVNVTDPDPLNDRDVEKLCEYEPELLVPEI